MKKFILLLLTISLVFTNIIKGDENQSINDFHYETYTVLGDSIAAGHSRLLKNND